VALASLLFSKSSRSNNLLLLSQCVSIQAGPESALCVNNKFKSTLSVILPERREATYRYLKFCCVIVSQSLGLVAARETMLCAPVNYDHPEGSGSLHRITYE
jgi:hypothetical protein